MVSGESRKGIVFWIGTERYVMDLEEVDGIMENKRPVPIPGSPPFVSGILNIRGALTVLFDLRKFLGVSGTRRSDIILMTVDGKSIGLLVDKVEDITDYSEHDVAPVPIGKSVESDLFAGVLKMGDETFIVLDDKAILRALEVGT